MRRFDAVYIVPYFLCEKKIVRATASSGGVEYQ